MRKSIHSPEYEVLLALLRRVRGERGVTQVQLAALLGTTQTFVSKSERGDRRIDVIELWRVCNAIGVPLAVFLARLELALGEIHFEAEGSGSPTRRTTPNG